MCHPLLATCVVLAFATLAAPAVAQIGGAGAKVVTYKAEKDATLKPVWDKAAQTLLPVWQKNKGAAEFREGVLLLLAADNARKAKKYKAATALAAEAGKRLAAAHGLTQGKTVSPGTSLAKLKANTALGLGKFITNAEGKVPESAKLTSSMDGWKRVGFEPDNI